ncbi:hypothetical protein [Pigmentiphaga sp. NML080357]
MSMKMEDDIKRWTAKLKKRATAAHHSGQGRRGETSRQYDRSPS